MGGVWKVTGLCVLDLNWRSVPGQSRDWGSLQVGKIQSRDRNGSLVVWSMNLAGVGRVDIDIFNLRKTDGRFLT